MVLIAPVVAPVDIHQYRHDVGAYTARVQIAGTTMLQAWLRFFRVLVAPGEVIRELARDVRDQGDAGPATSVAASGEIVLAERAPLAAQLQYCLGLIVLLPPIFAALGGVLFGWRLGATEPLKLGIEQAVIISFLYFLSLCFGFFGTVVIARWMGRTYGADAPLSVYFSFFTVVCAPLAVASIAHLFPHVFFNVLVLIPTLIWCMTLLYRGLPVVLQIPPERGMLMSSALVGWLLVAAVSLLGLSMTLWVAGIGPAVRI